MPPRPQPARKPPATDAAAASSSTRAAPPRPTTTTPTTTTGTTGTSRRTSRTTPVPSTTATTPVTRSTSTCASGARNASRLVADDKPTTSACVGKPRSTRSGTLNSIAKPHNTDTKTNNHQTSLGPASLASDLPPDALFQVFRWLSPRDVASASCTCSTWATAGRSEALWKALYNSRWGEKADPTTATTTTTTTTVALSSWRDRFRERWVRDAQARVNRALRRLCKISLVVKQQHNNNSSNNNNAHNIAFGRSRRAVNMLDITHTLAGEGFSPKSKGPVSGFPQSGLMRLNVDGGLLVKSLRSLKVACYSGVTENAFTALSADVGVNAAWTRVASAAGGMTLWQIPAGVGSAVFMGVFADDAANDEDNITNKQQQHHNMDPKAQVGFVAVSLHHADVLRPALRLRPVNNRPPARHDDVDPMHGLHGYFLSVQLRTLGKLLWHEDFADLHFDKHASVAAYAVFPLITNAKACGGQGVHFPGSISLPWRTDAFSGSLDGVLVADIGLWDESGAWVSHASRAIVASTMMRPCLQYNDFHGEVSYSEAGVSSERGVRVEFGFAEGVRRRERCVLIEKMELVLDREWLQERYWCVRL